jgi:hypothetical protein
VRRRDVDQASPSRQLVDDEPLLVHRNRGHPHTERREQHGCRRVPGILDGNGVSGLEDDPADEIERVLCPVGDQDVLGVAEHGPRDAYVTAHGLPQLEETGRIAIPPR